MGMKELDRVEVPETWKKIKERMTSLGQNHGSAFFSASILSHQPTLFVAAGIIKEVGK